MKRSRLWIVAAVLISVSVSYRPVRAGVTSLWTDDATLVQQLVQLMQISDEMRIVSDGAVATARATQNMMQLYSQAEALVQEMQDYSPEAFWRDFRRDLYRHYPGFGYLERGRLVNWKQSRTRSPAKAYNVISAVFADLTDPLLEKERRGELNTAELRIRQWEAAGAISLSNEAEATTEQFDKHIADLQRQVETIDGGDPSALISAKASLALAAQNSHIIRLLSRQVRLDGIDNAIQYGRRVSEIRETQAAMKSLTDVFGAESDEQKKTKKPYLMRFTWQ